MRMAKPSISPRSGAGSRAVKLANVQLWLGFGVTLAVAALHLAGVTERAELPLIDLRTRLFNVFTPPPSNEVVVVAIDDPSIATVGKWPWPRRYLGMAVRELERAGASVIALDLLHDDPQPLEVGAAGENAPAPLIDNDALLARSMLQHGRVVQGTSFMWAGEKAAAATSELAQRTSAKFKDVYHSVLRNPRVAHEELRAALLPGAPSLGPPAEDLQRKMDRSLTLLEAAPRSSILPPSDAVRWPLSDEPQPPVPLIGKSSAMIASVSFGGGDVDGGVRRIPLWVRDEVGNRLYPTLGLAAAALHLRIPLADISVGANETEMAAPTRGDITIPTHRARLQEFVSRGSFDGIAYVAWPRGGFGGWKTQFAAAVEGRLRTSELALGVFTDPERIIIPAIRFNIERLDEQTRVLSELFGLADLKAYEPRAAELARLSPEDARWRQLLAEQRAVWARIAAEAGDLLTQARESIADPAAMTPEEKEQIGALERTVRDAPAQAREIETGLTQLDALRAQLAERIKGRICFVGWTATGSLADFVRTSIDSRTPGVHLHAAVANAILNSVDDPQFIREAPGWVNFAAIIALGILGTIIGVRLGVLVSPVVLVGALGLWFLVDGVLFWDWRNLLVAEAAPMGAALLAWLTVILHRLLVEQRGRRQTEARFRSYVSPDVVDILVNNPGLDSMRPQRRELTIFFSDIAGWTTLAERLGAEGIYIFLATYLKEMTNILQANRATIDKYLGDGIMAFWGAPIEDPDHAANAVRAVNLMQQKLAEMNESGAFGPAGRISVRIGVASGEVNVGDFGNPPDKSAYTVIGDAANLSARLESANKQFGTLTLINERTRLLAGLASGARLIGKIIVKGKTEPETIWEPIGERRPKGERTSEWIELTTRAVEAYIARDFEGALAGFDVLDREFGDRDLAQKYREAIREISEQGGPGPGFVGAIVLSEK